MCGTLFLFPNSYLKIFSLFRLALAIIDLGKIIRTSKVIMSFLCNSEFVSRTLKWLFGVHSFSFFVFLYGLFIFILRSLVFCLYVCVRVLNPLELA